jgi:hypothetical protein
MMEWNCQKTREEIQRVYGKDQLNLASPSLRSALDRHEYARIHYHATLDLLDEFVETKFQDKSLLEVILSNDESEHTCFQDFILKVGAHVTACIQSLHAAVDILAHAVYYALGLNKNPNPLKARDINTSVVISILEKDENLNNLSELLKKLRNEGNFSHIDALANHSKHRSVVAPSINEDQAGLAAERYTIKLEAFKYKEKEYKQIAIKELLEPEYNRCALLVIEIGNELNKVLCAK